MTMRRLLATAILAAGLLASSIGLAQPAAANHNYPHAVCEWTAVQQYGPGNIGLNGWTQITAWGDPTVYWCRGVLLWVTNGPVCVSWLVDVDPGSTKIINLGYADCFGPWP
jgi:hypothetical protein